jgi:flagellin-like protein
MKFTRNEDAVSPVIGVILMVAITVILAAVIAAFVFGMAGNINKTKIVAATASQSGTTVWITYQGGQDSADVIEITCDVDQQGVQRMGDGSTAGSATVGATRAFPVTAGSAKNHAVATAKFVDGTTQVILDTYV